MARFTIVFPLLAVLCVGAASAQTDEGLAGAYPEAAAGRPTASGEAYDPAAFTAAHPLLRFGSRLAVTNPADGRTVTVRINDRGPSDGARILDLSRAAASALGLPEGGTLPVTVRVLRAGEPDVAVRAFVPTPEEDAYFQTGAFRTLANARTQARALEAKGYRPQVRRDGGLFRVYLAVPTAQAAGLSRKLGDGGWKGVFQLAREPRGELVILPTD